eukprot:CAMPEP_0179464264 /NCGR_PEP_ID=MMETSP0799-20121207/46132_1 /TAXON_ID=46947 /ORGANISM="Geminigera cryophila, Strain CCMP2564" /LENGTH=124 /DNA_ID=CAMNT_0021267977 /DNA_START=234 /DNA_END=608 /DNA_ORIENTATION=+
MCSSLRQAWVKSPSGRDKTERKRCHGSAAGRTRPDEGDAGTDVGDDGGCKWLCTLAVTPGSSGRPTAAGRADALHSISDEFLLTRPSIRSALRTWLSRSTVSASRASSSSTFTMALPKMLAASR